MLERFFLKSVSYKSPVLFFSFYFSSQIYFLPLHSSSFFHSPWILAKVTPFFLEQPPLLPSAKPLLPYLSPPFLSSLLADLNWAPTWWYLCFIVISTLFLCWELFVLFFSLLNFINLVDYLSYVENNTPF